MREPQYGDDPADLVDHGEEDPLPRALQIPTVVLLAVIWAAWLWHFPGGMSDWGLSGSALSDGHYENTLLHMFAHAGLLHIGMNSAVLFALGGIVQSYMGNPSRSWLRFLAFYLLSGLAGAAVYLAINPDGSVPMVGASGAISGLIGMAARLHRDGSGLMSLTSGELRKRIWDFVKANLVLILIITVPIFLLGGEGGIAWEAHLGGFLVGLFAARFFIEPEFAR